VTAGAWIGRIAIVGLVVACGSTARSPVPSPSAAPRSPIVAGPGSWERGADAPLPLTDVAAAALRARIWVVAGLDARAQSPTEVQIYEPATDTWSTGPPIPEPVNHASLVSTGSELYLIGGYRGSQLRDPVANVWRLDPEADAWVEAPHLPLPRAAGAAAWDGVRIVYAGGVGLTGVAGEVYTLAPGDEGWREIGRLSTAREHLGAATDAAGLVFFLGGRVGGLDSNLGLVDVVDGGGIASLGDLLTPRGGVGGFFAPDAGACLAGGEGPSGTFVEVECVSVSGTVTKFPDLAHPRHGLGAAVVDGVAYTLLGGPTPGLSVSGTVESLLLVPAS
jgi:non-specific serine/threonine protein kinase